MSTRDPARQVGHTGDLAAGIDNGFFRRDEESTRPECGSSGRRASYNTSLHVAALFIILILSTLACAFPIIARRFPNLPIPHRFLFLSRHFGTGVLIATAFVHLLPTAFVSLTDPCLPYLWRKGYPAMAGLIAMASVFLVVVIEMVFAMRGAGHIHGSEWGTLPIQEGDAAHPLRTSGGLPDGDPGLRRKVSGNGAIRLHRRTESQQGLVEGLSIRPNSHPGLDQTSNSDSDSDLEVFDPMPQSPPARASHDHHHHHHHRAGSGRSQSSKATHDPTPTNPQRLLLQCLLLEAGILFHSVFIGMALSVSTGTPFVVLLVAISFHQTFEGLALGSRISSLIPALFPPDSIKPWLMALAYGTTTPIGQAIGLGMHELYDPASAMGLLSMGITNAISSGLLLFAGLVELLAEDFLSDASYHTLSGRRRLEACLSVGAGAVLMAIVGAFA